MNSLINLVGDDIMNIIYNNQFEMEREDRIVEHRENFEEVLLEINSRRYMGRERELYDLILEDLFIETNNNEIIEVVWGQSELELVNMNNWVGMSERSMLNDLLNNFKWVYQYNRVEFFNEFGGEDDIERMDMIWENMGRIGDFMDEIFSELDFGFGMYDYFIIDWVSENV